MAEMKMRLVDWLDDLCVRFIINMPKEELESVERICFQVEEAQWFYEDFIRPMDPTLPSMNLRKFALLIFQHCPLLSPFSSDMHETAYDEFLAYRQRVPVRGAIMLNDTMDHVVLVKGWKKGSRWSFPRGKINKGEKDLDCAIREVYEETGFEIREAGLVKDEENEKYIEVAMRDQQIRLYVFRNVPMDTYFEPRTRKEISKIDWYKLWELPTLKKQRQTQGTGDELLKDSMFYMVAPFLGTLKHWIKQQHKLDRAKAAKDQIIVETDTEDIAPVDGLAVLSGTVPDPVGAHAPSGQHDGHFNTLLAGLRSSVAPEPDHLQEMSAEQTPDDPAAALKRLLSVNSSATSDQTAGGQAPAPPNPLLAMLQGNPSGSFSQPVGAGIPPRTPMDQVKNVPQTPQSPHHQHPHPPLVSNMPPPPSFPYPQNHQQFPHPVPRPPPLQHTSFGTPPNRPSALAQQIPSRAPQPHMQQRSIQQHIAPQYPAFGPQGGPASRAYQQTRDLQSSGILGPTSPPISKLPAPRLNAHSLSLLNAFKAQDQAQAAPKIESDAQRAAKVYAAAAQVSTHHKLPTPSTQIFSGLNSLSSARSPGPQSAGRVSSPEQTTVQEPIPKKNEHHNALLHLFRTPSAPAVSPALKVPHASEPVELSAQPSPGLSRHPRPNTQQTAKILIPSTLNASMNLKPGMTSATVSGPLNSPDFDTVRQKSQLTSPAEVATPTTIPTASAQEGLNAPFAPMTILQRPKNVTASAPVSKTPPVPFHSVSPKTQLEQPTPRPFQPYILRRSQQTPSPVISVPQIQVPKLQTQQVPPVAQFDRRESHPSEQKNALLSLFSTGRATPKSLQQPPPQPVQNPTLFSGIISTVSPLPEKQHSHPPAASEPRSRISSLNSSSAVDAALGEKGKRTAQQSPVTPVDRNFLLGYLQGVVKGSQK